MGTDKASKAINLDPYPAWIPGVKREQLRWHIHLADYSPDMRLLAVSPPATPLTIYDAKSKRLLWKFFKTTGVNGLDWSPDSKRIAVADNDGVYVLDAETGKSQYVYSGLNSRIWSPEWSPDGKYLLAIGFLTGQQETTAVLQVWHADSRKLLFKLSDGPATSAHWAPDGRRVAFNGAAIEVWDVFDQKRIVEISIPKRGWPPFAWSPSWDFIVAADLGTGEATIYDAGSGKSIARHKFSEDLSHIDWLSAATIRAVSDKTEIWNVACDASGKPKSLAVPQPVLGDKGYIPRDIADCIRQLDATLPKATIKEIMSKSEDDMASYHLGLGMWLRNNWGLRSGSELATYFDRKGITTPDRQSGVILDAYWKHLHGKPFDLDALFKRP